MTSCENVTDNYEKNTFVQSSHIFVATHTRHPAREMHAKDAVTFLSGCRNGGRLFASLFETRNVQAERNAFLAQLLWKISDQRAGDRRRRSYGTYLQLLRMQKYDLSQLSFVSKYKMALLAESRRITHRTLPQDSILLYSCEISSRARSGGCGMKVDLLASVSR